RAGGRTPAPSTRFTLPTSWSPAGRTTWSRRKSTTTGASVEDGAGHRRSRLGAPLRVPRRGGTDPAPKEGPVIKNILITGGAGFIGSNLVRLLRRERPDWTVVNLDKLTYAGNAESLADLRDDPKHVFVRGDIANAELVEHLIRNHSVDAILNLAAESHVDRSIPGPS